MVEVIAMTRRTLGKIQEQVDALDFEAGSDRDQRNTRNVTRGLAEDQHLAYRALAAYFAERANNPESLVLDAMQQVGDLSSIRLALMDKSVSIDHAPEVAKVDRSSKMPIITIGTRSKIEVALLTGMKPTKTSHFTPCAKYRYNPKSDKLQRIG